MIDNQNNHANCRGGHGNGFMLMEVMVAIAIIAILIGVLFSLFSGVGQLRLFGEAQIEAVEQGRAAANEIAKSVSQSHRVLANQTIGGADYYSSASTVVLQLPAINGNKDIVEGAWDYAVFYLSGNDLYFLLQPDGASTRAAAQKRLSDSIFGLEFTYDDYDFAKVRNVGADIGIRRAARDQIVSSREVQKIELKNY